MVRQNFNYLKLKPFEFLALYESVLLALHRETGGVLITINAAGIHLQHPYDAIL